MSHFKDVKCNQDFPEIHMNDALHEEISNKDILSTLSSFQKGKSSGLDGLTVEFYLGLYDLLKDDILKVAKESKKSRKIVGSFNATFLALIPKNKEAISFEDFRPISCCNLIYKLIAKIIALCLNPILSEIISEEQYRFLFKCQIHDTIAITQEALHSIKSKNLSSVVLKLDLSKAYDKVNWTFVRLVLIRLGMNLNYIVN
jgi:hypothetical protein